MISFRPISNVPHVPLHVAIGDVRNLSRNPIEVFERYRLRYGPTFTFHFAGVRPTLVTTDPEVLEHVLKRNSANYHKSDIQTERMGEFQGQGLLNAHGQLWQRQRAFLAKTFMKSRLSKLLPEQRQVLTEERREFDRLAGSGVVDVYDLMVRLTLRLVGKSLFGQDIEHRHLERIGWSISEIQAFMLKQIVRPYAIPWYQLSGRSAYYQRIRERVDQVLRDYIAERMRQIEGEGEDREMRGDALDHMLGATYSDTGEKMPTEQVVIESQQLLIAGNETSSIALSWTFYLLSRHPEVAKRIREEAREVLGDGDFSLDDLWDLRYTTQVLEEAMRLYPSFWMIDRIALKEDHVKGVHIPAGIMVSNYIYGTHRNREHWHEPERFDPSRFDPEVKKSRHAFAHLPFGGGPRVCVGQRMAMMQMLLLVSSIVRDYEFELEPDQTIQAKPMMLTRPGSAIPLRFRPARQASEERGPRCTRSA